MEVLAKLMSFPKSVSQSVDLTSLGLFSLKQSVGSLSLQMPGLDLRPLPVTILMGKLALGRIFLLSTSVFFCQHHFTNAPYSTLS